MLFSPQKHHNLSRVFCFFMFIALPLYSYATDFEEVVKLLPTTANTSAHNYQMGNAVAIDGEWMVVGAYVADTTQAADTGAVYVYRRINSKWVFQQQLTANDAASSDYYGFSVGVSGNYIVVGAYRDDDRGGDSGSAYVYQWNGVSWNQSQKLTAVDGAAKDYYGVDVAIGSDRMVVGAHGDDNRGGASGAVYSYRLINGQWIFTAKIFPNDGASDDQFGRSLAMSGTTLAVGAYRDDVDVFLNAGSVYIYDANGNTWTQRQKITANDSGVNDYFGFDVAIDSSDLVVGAYLNDDVPNDSGAVYTYSKVDDFWTLNQKITAFDAKGGDSFGYAVGIDQGVLVIGARYDDNRGSNSGAVYVYQKITSGWSFEQNLLASDGASSDNFGTAVAVNSTAIVVGAPFNDDVGSNSGSAYVFEEPELFLVSLEDLQPGGPANGVALVTSRAYGPDELYMPVYGLSPNTVYTVFLGQSGTTGALPVQFLGQYTTDANGSAIFEVEAEIINAYAVANQLVENDQGIATIRGAGDVTAGANTIPLNWIRVYTTGTINVFGTSETNSGGGHIMTSKAPLP